MTVVVELLQRWLALVELTITQGNCWIGSISNAYYNLGLLFVG